MTKNADETYKNVQGNLIVTLFTKEKPEAIHKFTSKTCVHKVGFLIKYKFMSNIPFELSALTQSEFLQIDVNNKLNCHDLWIFKFLLVYHKSFYLINYSMKHNISYDRCLIHYELFSFIPISLASTA